jgi:hypothetical protein
MSRRRTKIPAGVPRVVAKVLGDESCARCSEAVERAEMVARGTFYDDDGQLQPATPNQIRAALRLLERQPKMGTTVVVPATSGGRMRVCPWCTGICTDDTPFTNRAMRRQARTRVNV